MITGWQGHVLDTAFVEQLIYEVRWSLSIAPTVLTFGPVGTNDSAITPDNNPLIYSVFGLNVTDAGGGVVNGSPSTAGRGFILVKDMPRYVALNGGATGLSGSLTGSLIIRAFGYGK